MMAIILDLLGALCVVGLVGYGAWKLLRPAVKREIQDYRRGD
jgi:hypothetical protein